ncbi:hypothetical protein L524_0056 [Bordetella bronchiseptica MBORD762]|nr:hypothetical protein L569_0054 [Bordetella pertussis 2250905]ETH23638.1 hypothetical protein L564_0054 [Bordetella pertussis CHLA-15]ETH25833.1 hypothetical protein L565_0053 [Bordetella pertussis CHLA-20]ETH73581.1 hypothetical protein L555_0053 [Bordetella pertussis STO1-CHOC-0008]KDB61143.1 hypothetical protein AZ15_0065 [Bordetella bronchiseptica A1-7]KDB71276.1 hypothetical protein AZ21_0055 [Bordetella bronchiseptica B20-10725633]KDB81827.1 hypothetical protein L495_0055 [Bordetella 
MAVLWWLCEPFASPAPARFRHFGGAGFAVETAAAFGPRFMRSFT